MEVNSSRFGRFSADAEDLLLFPAGIIGLEDCQRWLMLADHRIAAVAWLQSVERPELALAVTCPRRYVPTYRARIDRRQLAALELADGDRAEVLTIITSTNRGLALNLKAPLVVHVDRGLGCQIIVEADAPLHYELKPTCLIRRTA